MKKLWRSLQRYVKKNRAAVAILLIVGLAIFFRFWKLYSLPPGLYEDEAANGLDIFRIQDGDIRPFYPSNNGREALFIFLQAIFVSIFGNSIIALRIAPALIGVGAVLATYALTKEWFGHRAGLLAMFITATASWAVTISRNGFRAGMVVLMIPLTLWLFTKAVKRKGWWWYVLAGASFGLGFYTYLAYRFVVVVVLLLLIYCTVYYRQWLKSHLLKLLLASGSALIILLPLGIYGYHHPDEVFNTRSSVSFTNPDFNNGQPIQTLAKNIGKTALMFNFTGDKNYRHNLGGAPMLNAVVGIMLVFGLLLCARRFRDWRYFSLLTVFSVMLLPEVLSAEGIPHGLRAVGVMPIVFVIATVGIKELLGRWRGVFPRNPAALSIGLAILGSILVLSTYYDYQRYFVAWANAPQTYEAYSEDAVAIADYMIERPNKSYYVVTDSNKNRTVEYLTGSKSRYRRIDASQIPEAAKDSSAEIIVDKANFLAADPLVSEAGIKQVVSYESPNRVNIVLYRVYLPKPAP